MLARTMAHKTAIALLIASTIAMPATSSSQVGISRFPKGMMQVVGGAVQTDDFVVVNAGSDPASLTITTTGAFFTVSPSSFALSPNASQTVTIHPGVSAGGLYDGSVNVFASGVAQPISIPVRLFIGTPPQGSVSPNAAAGQVVIAPPAGTPHSGGTNIANFGTAAMQGIVVPGVPWIVPQQTNVIGIPSKGQALMSFSVDSSRRPDAIAPMGAALGTVSMIYLNGTSNGPGISSVGVATSNGPPSGSVNVLVIDVIKTTVANQAPPPLAAGEVAWFLPGVTDSNGYFTDVFLSNRATNSIADLRLFFAAAGAAPATSILANFANFPSGTSSWFPFSPSSLFNVSGAIGTAQVRSAQSVSVSISALRGIFPDGTNRYLTALPVLRSDRSIAGNERLTLAGVEKSATARTDLLLQETSGFDGAYTVDFFDGAGAPVSPSRSGSILPFGALALADVVPAGARSARITNTSSGAARLTAMATVVDGLTGDLWTIIDASRFPAPAGELILPMPQLAGAPSSTVDVWISNTGSSPISVVVSTRPPSRRRIVGAGGPAPGTALNLAAGETRRMQISSAPNGWIRISGPAGAFSATARVVSTVAGRSGTFGAGVPAFTAAAATGIGAVKRFARALDIPNVSPPTLILMEAAHTAATVRATIRFFFAAGSTVSGQVTASKDYNLAAGQTLAIPDITTAILGSQRASLGTLTNYVVDVEVVSGEGRILPFLQTIDASGDLTLSFD